MSEARRRAETSHRLIVNIPFVTLTCLSLASLFFPFLSRPVAMQTVLLVAPQFFSPTHSRRPMSAEGSGGGGKCPVQHSSSSSSAASPGASGSVGSGAAKNAAGGCPVAHGKAASSSSSQPSQCPVDHSAFLKHMGQSPAPVASSSSSSPSTSATSSSSSSPSTSGGGAGAFLPDAPYFTPAKTREGSAAAEVNDVFPDALPQPGGWVGSAPG